MRTSLQRTSDHQHEVPSYISQIPFIHYCEIFYMDLTFRAHRQGIVSPLPMTVSILSYHFLLFSRIVEAYRIVRASDLRNTRRPRLSRTRVVPRKSKAIGLVLQQGQVLLDHRGSREGSSRS